MALREASREVQQRAPELTQRIHTLGEALLLAAAHKHDQRCVVCRLAASTNQPRFVLPVSYIATILVLNDLDEQYPDLPLRTAFLCPNHETHFDALFVDVAEAPWNLERLERRAEVLGGVMIGSLLVFGGSKAVRVVREFQASVAALKRSVQHQENSKTHY